MINNIILESKTQLGQNLNLMLAFIDENIFSKSLAKALESIFVSVAPISTNADAIDSYSSVAIDPRKTSMAAHVFGDIRPTIPVKLSQTQE